MRSLVDERVWLINADNREVYPRIGNVAAVITDPPYGEFAHNKDRVARRRDGEVDATPIPFGQLTPEDAELLGEFLRTRCLGWALVFSETEQIAMWRSYIEDEERKHARYFRPMLWIKPDAKPNLKGHGPGIGHETIQAYWCQGYGKQRWNGGGKIGIFYHTRNRRTDGGFKHPTEKPVPLMKDLIRLFTNPGDVVFDPFMGCGSTGIAALELGRRFVGVERNRVYFEEALRRIRETLAAPVLWAEDRASMPTLLGDSAYGSSNTKKRLRREAAERA